MEFGKSQKREENIWRIIIVNERKQKIPSFDVESEVKNDILGRIKNRAMKLQLSNGYYLRFSHLSHLLRQVV